MYHFIRCNRDPNLLPIRVRSYVVGTVVLIFLILSLLSGDIWHKSAACGVILGIFGAGVLYWETVADDCALQSVNNEIARTSSRSLSFSEIITVIKFSHYGILLFFVSLFLLLLHFKSGDSSVSCTVQRIVISLFISILPALVYYLFMKMLRFSCSNWFQKFEATSQSVPTAQTKRLLRTIGFASLFVSGIMQLPATVS